MPVSNAEILTDDEKRLGITDKEGICNILIPAGKVLELKIRKDNYESKIYTLEPTTNPHNTLAVIPIKVDTIEEEEEIILLTDENGQPVDSSQDVISKLPLYFLFNPFVVAGTLLAHICTL